MKNYDELTAMLAQGASISRERNMNLDFAKAADEAATAIQELQAEIATTARIAQAVITKRTSERDEYRKAADEMAAAHKVERDALAYQALGYLKERNELRAKLAALQSDDELPPLPGPEHRCEHANHATTFTVPQVTQAMRDAQAMLRSKLEQQEPVGYAYAHQDFIGSVIGAKGEWAPNEIPLFLAVGSPQPTDDVVATMREMLAVQGYEGNWNYDDYMCGMYNGMEYMLAMVERRYPAFRTLKGAAPQAQDQTDWKDQYEYQKRRAEMWIAKYEKDIGPLEKAAPQGGQQ
jgi:hypothetical protein